jgi:hypothetical protein
VIDVDPAVHDALVWCAADELRSTNIKVEFLVRPCTVLGSAAGC